MRGSHGVFGSYWCFIGIFLSRQRRQVLQPLHVQVHTLNDLLDRPSLLVEVNHVVLLDLDVNGQLAVGGDERDEETGGGGGGDGARPAAAGGEFGEIVYLSDCGH